MPPEPAFGEGLANRFIFPAPEPSYGTQSYKRHLCWIPWNSVISPDRVADDRWSDGIPCLWFPAPKAATVIMFFHANAEDLGMSFAVLKHMRDQFKVNVLAVEYPGYGLLQGIAPSEDAVYEVSLTAFRFLVDEIGVRYSQIILFGRSLGSGPAVYLAAQYPVGGLILVSAFSSIRAAVQSIAGRIFSWTFKERFPNSRIIANVSCSTLFIHGGNDGLIPAEHSLRLFRRCRARKLLITPPKMEHNSNLFGDASFLAVPAIHFFGFPGYYTTTPPRLPACLFENPDRRKRVVEGGEAQGPGGLKPWLCDCLGKSENQHMDVTFCRPEHSVEDITIRFFANGAGASTGEAAAGGGGAQHGAEEGRAAGQPRPGGPGAEEGDDEEEETFHTGDAPEAFQRPNAGMQGNLPRGTNDIVEAADMKARRHLQPCASAGDDDARPTSAERLQAVRTRNKPTHAPPRRLVAGECGDDTEDEDGGDDIDAAANAAVSAAIIAAEAAFHAAAAAVAGSSTVATLVKLPEDGMHVVPWAATAPASAAASAAAFARSAEEEAGIVFDVDTPEQDDALPSIPATTAPAAAARQEGLVSAQNHPNAEGEDEAGI
mmetsp:Transcript_2597/g.7762  ORF Transcript_2597/g.7762 Transcript_2597/m.7762 type:complete len:601 (-) Transcript_2597:61-1863(-)